ncbi:outer membrane protein assembly factor BamB family protein [Maioricimonas rarisocia]|nr:PQQ-binding-like beta-propeller repeat protein [Maioricimonas rarisocia]
MSCILASAALPLDADVPPWNSFRGPGGQGQTTARILPLEWNETNNVTWKTPVSGRGHSSPVVDDGMIWISTARTDGSALGVVGLDLDSGEIRHSVTVFRPDHVEEIHSDNTYASPTPVAADGRVFVHFGRYGTACLDSRTGEVLWRNDELVIEHQGGPGSSPVLFEDLLIVTCDGADRQFLAGLDTATGEIRWKTDRSAPFRPNPITHRAFATPLLIEFEGTPQLISPGADQVHAYDPRTGSEIWHVRYTGFSNVPAPVYADGVVYVCTGFFGPELWAIRVDGSGNVTDTHVLWKLKGRVPETPSPILHDGFVYMVANMGVAACVDGTTGKRTAVLRLGGNYSASPVSGGGHLYFCGEDGMTRVVRPGPKPRVVASNRLAGGIFASPAIVGNAIIIRTEEAVYRIESPGE